MTKDYTIIDSKTKAIVRYISCLPCDVEANCAENESVVEGTVKSETSSQDILIEIRQMRDSALAFCDWTHLSDSPLSPSKKAEWATYRQSLRDIPSNYSSETSLDDVNWPSQPST